MEALGGNFKTAELSRTLASRFRAADEELFLVGGAVRDALLGIESDEADFATSSLPERTFQILRQVPGAHPYRIGEKFGTIGALVDDLRVEITTYRVGERYDTGSRKPEVRFGKSLIDDLSRRDFTINAIAADPDTFTVIDPLHGRDDIRERQIRAVGTADKRFKEDPLRLLRAVRFAARLDFGIEATTWNALMANAAMLERISRERIRDEYSLMLTSMTPSRAFRLLLSAGLIEHSVPELLQLTHMPDHGPRHPLSLWDHEMRVVDAVPARLELRWAALLHDIAKPATRTHEANGRPRFFNHEEVGAEIARTVLSGLRYPRNFIDDVSMLVAGHMQIHGYSPEWSDGAVRRLIRRMGPCLEDAIELARADAAGHALTGESENSPKYDELQARIQALSASPTEEMTSPLTGNDLMKRYEREPGPWIRSIKDALEEEVLEGRLQPMDRDGAWEIADRLIGSDAAR